VGAVVCVYVCMYVEAYLRSHVCTCCSSGVYVASLLLVVRSFLYTAALLYALLVVDSYSSVCVFCFLTFDPVFAPFFFFFLLLPLLPPSPFALLLLTQDTKESCSFTEPE
jgi:hypothetical protein